MNEPSAGNMPVWMPLFFLLMAVLLAFDIFKSYASVKWPSVPGTIIKMQDATALHERGVRKFDLEYSYEVDGKLYTSNRIAFGEGNLALTSKKKLDTYLALYPEGTKVTVFYDPNNPARATLRCGPNTGQLIVVIFIFMAFLLLFAKWV
ncbi:MAG: DUF3592 domain-containing protein [Bacteroidota bacterium]